MVQVYAGMGSQLHVYERLVAYVAGWGLERGCESSCGGGQVVQVWEEGEQEDRVEKGVREEGSSLASPTGLTRLLQRPGRGCWVGQESVKGKGRLPFWAPFRAPVGQNPKISCTSDHLASMPIPWTRSYGAESRPLGRSCHQFVTGGT